MQTKLIARFSLALALGAALTASPALAQGKGKGHEKARDRQEQRRPELRRRSPKEQEKIRKEQEKIRKEQEKRRQEALRREYEARRRTSVNQNGRARNVPPGWCTPNNPHNTVENCGYGSQRSRDSYGRYDGYGNNGSYGRYANSSSYDAAHRDFHRYLDRKYSELAARRPVDIPWQLQLRRQKQAEHDNWHRQAGRGH